MEPQTLWQRISSLPNSTPVTFEPNPKKGKSAKRYDLYGGGGGALWAIFEAA